MNILKKILYFTLLIVVFCPLQTQAAEIRLSVAASMTDVIKEMLTDFGKKHPGVKALPNFGSSGSLAKQIVQGAPADFYISANRKWITYLLNEKKIIAETVQVFAFNSLVFVGSKTSDVGSSADLPKLKRIAIGSPRSVPAGQYAVQVMQATGVYDELVNDKKLIMAKDVRQALLYADRGEIDGAFVYRTDALLAQNAVILFTVPAALHDRISYQLGLTASGQKNPAALAFKDYMSSPAAVGILEKFGFDAGFEETAPNIR